MPLTAHFEYGLYSARFEWDPAEFPLKPCPFCGSDWLTLESAPGLFYQAGCRNCGTSTRGCSPRVMRGAAHEA